MPFNLRQLLRKLDPVTLRAHLDAKGIAVPESVWKRSSLQIAAKLTELLVTGTDKRSHAAAIGDLNRVDAIATEKGRVALLSADADSGELRQTFALLEHDADRALWTLTYHPEIFDTAEALFFFDHFFEGQRGQHFRTQSGHDISQDDADVAAFQGHVCAIYRKLDGSGISCNVEFIDRRDDESVQVAIYVEGLPSRRVEVQDGEFQRILTHPAIEAAIVYDRTTGDTYTVTRGGKVAHEALREAFARDLLRIEPDFDIVVRRPFILDSLQLPRKLPPDPESAIRSARVRMLRLAPLSGSDGHLSIEASPDPSTSVYDLGNSWFNEQVGLFRKFNVVHATIALHFHRDPEAKRSKTLNVELTWPNTSNLKSFGESDRAVVEAHIERWNLIAPLD